VGDLRAHAIMASRLPLGTPEAHSLKLIDDHAGPDAGAFRALIDARAAGLAMSDRFDEALAEKRRQRALDEQRRPLADYRAEELARMGMNFFGFDPSYHIARHRFVCRTPHAWTPLHLARHRRAAA
jgi:putative two-component system hydrogenase maturation factor HypX/HoxX